jgi:hypothetical protein
MSYEGNVGAFFDLDGTLLPRPSVERRFILFHEESSRRNWS